MTIFIGEITMPHDFLPNLLRFLFIACIAMLFVSPVHAFTANSLDITIDKSGDAVASFKFTLDGFLENAIPQSMLEEELKKGLTTSSESPVLLSMDKTGATMLLKKFADTQDVAQGTEYRTASMNFQKAEIALKNSALGSVVTADFSPSKITVTFPDAYTKKFENSAVLPALTHIVIDPLKPATAIPRQKNGLINVTASPAIVSVSVDGTYAGDSPQTFSDIPAGTYTFLFEKEGFSPVTKTVTVVENRTTNVFVFLTAQPAKTPSGLLSLPGFGLVIACLAVGSCVILRRIA
ncbi:MAG: PEGA domain-containing protein [Methanoregula sp.]|nr:PEGA domain-containing protein [Methanoregula sp.]